MIGDVPERRARRAREEGVRGEVCGIVFKRAFAFAFGFGFTFLFLLSHSLVWVAPAY